MITIAQDSNNDIVVENHDIKIASGVDAYAIIIADAVRTVLDELQLDIGRGIDYFGTVFNNVNGLPNWKAKVSNIIRGYDFVRSIGDITASIDSESKHLSYSITIETDKETATVNG